MAFNTSDYLIQQVLDEAIKTNDHLSAMRDLMLKDSKKRSGSSGSGGSGSGSGGNNGRQNPPPGGNNKGAYSKAFKSLFGEAATNAKMMMKGPQSAATAMGGLGMSAKVLSGAFSKIPGPIGLVATAFTQVASAGMELYQYMNEQLKMYNDLNSAGVTLEGGIQGLNKGAYNALMGQTEFSEAVVRNSRSIAAMNGEYANGVEHFGKLLNGVQKTEAGLNALGVSQSQLADLAAVNYKYDKLHVRNAALRQMNEEQSTVRFVQTMTNLSKNVGMSVQELMNQFNKASDTVDTRLIKNNMMNYWGVNDEMASKMTKEFNAYSAGMGDAGDALTKIYSSIMTLGHLPEEYNFATVISDYIRTFESLNKSGMSAEEMTTRMQQWTRDNRDNIIAEMNAARQSGNEEVARFTASLLNIADTAGKMAEDNNRASAKLATMFNTWFSDSIQKPLGVFWNETEEGMYEWAYRMVQGGNGFWGTTAAAVENIFNDAVNYLDSFFGGISETLEKLGGKIFGDKYTQVSLEFEKFMDQFMDLPKKLWDKVMGWWNGGDDAKVNNDGKSAFDVMTQDAADGFNSMLEGVKSWWNSDSTKVTDTKKTITPQITSKSDYTPPAAITVPEKEEAPKISPSDPAQLQAAATQESLLRAISQLLNTVEGQNALASQNNILMRQLVDNTEPARNV